MKWSFPHFMHHGILCSMASFKAHCAFGFWKEQLMTGTQGRAGAVPPPANPEPRDASVKTPIPAT